MNTQKKAHRRPRTTASHAECRDIPRETVQHYLRRGGVVTPCPPRWSRHLTEDQVLLSRILGGTAEDTDRGFAWSDLPSVVRETIAAATENHSDDSDRVHESEEDLLTFLAAQLSRHEHRRAAARQQATNL